MKRYLIRIRYRAVTWLVACLLSSAIGNATAEGWQYEGSVFFDRHASDSEDNGESRQSLESRLGAAIKATRPYQLETGHSGDFILGASHERYPANRRADRYFLDAGVNHRIPMSFGRLRQMRIFAEARHARDHHDWVFNRIRVGMSLNWAVAPRNGIQTRARIGYRDQNDSHTFAGYDQFELLLDVGHNWRSADGIWRTYSAAYFERRDADLRRYSYDEIGVRFSGRRKLTDEFELLAKGSWFTRDYDEGGRSDWRLTGTIGVGWKVIDNTVFEAHIGYQKNRSTFDTKDYGGGLIGARLSRTF